MKKIEAVKLIRKELQKPLGANGVDLTMWGLVEKLSEQFNLEDTAYRDKILRHEKEGLLRDYLLDVKYWKRLSPPEITLTSNK